MNIGMLYWLMEKVSLCREVYVPYTTMKCEVNWCSHIWWEPQKYKASIAAWQRCSKAEPQDGSCDTFHFDLNMLQVWGVHFNICVTLGYWICGKFLMNNFCVLPGVLLLTFIRKVLIMLLFLLAGRYSYLLEGHH